MKQSGTDRVTPCLSRNNFFFFLWFLGNFWPENGSIGIGPRRGGPVHAVFMYIRIIFSFFTPGSFATDKFGITEILW